jgi:hypothetical protein
MNELCPTCTDVPLLDEGGVHVGILSCNNKPQLHFYTELWLRIRILFVNGFEDVGRTLGIIHQSFIDNKSLRSHKSVEIKVVLKFFCLFM